MTSILDLSERQLHSLLTTAIDKYDLPWDHTIHGQLKNFCFSGEAYTLLFIDENTNRTNFALLKEAVSQLGISALGAVYIRAVVDRNLMMEERMRRDHVYRDVVAMPAIKTAGMGVKEGEGEALGELGS